MHTYTIHPQLHNRREFFCICVEVIWWRTTVLTTGNAWKFFGLVRNQCKRLIVRNCEASETYHTIIVMSTNVGQGSTGAFLLQSATGHTTVCTHLWVRQSINHRTLRVTHCIDKNWWRHATKMTSRIARISDVRRAYAPTGLASFRRFVLHVAARCCWLAYVVARSTRLGYYKRLVDSLHEQPNFNMSSRNKLVVWLQVRTPIPT